MGSLECKFYSMNYFSDGQLSNFWENNFHFLNIEENVGVFFLTLNRPNKKNALHPQMINEIAFCFNYISKNKNVRLVIIKSSGDTFSAGADLKALKNNVEPHKSSIPEPSKKIIIGNLFNSLYKPKLAVVQGNVYAGGCLIVAGCNYVISCDNLSYSLPEVKRGIFPLQVMESLSHIIGLKKTIDWCIRGYKIDTNKAFDWGLVDQICRHDELEKSINDWVSSFSENSQRAIEFGLKIYHEHFQDNSKHEKLEKLFREMVEHNQLSTDF